MAPVRQGNLVWAGCFSLQVAGMVCVEACMPLITITGIRNEYWRKELGRGQAVSPLFARLLITRGVQHHPNGELAVYSLLTCPPQTDPSINPWGDCDMLKVDLLGEVFYLKVDCYARSWDPSEASPDPENDSITTRVYTIMLASEY